MFTKTVVTDASVVKVLFAPRARIDVFLREREVKREDDDEGDADS